MPVKVSDVIAFGSFVSGILTYMKAKKKTMAILPLLVGVGALVVSIFSRGNGDGSITQTATTSGSNSPAINLSATASGSGVVNQAGRDLTVNQAGRDLTIINQGVSDATVLAILR